MNYWKAVPVLWVWLIPTVGGNIPPYWDYAANHMSDFPMTAGETIIDPWNYIQRLGIYKVMLNITSRAMESFGPNNEGNILWGLPLQFGWQFSTGRLRDFQNELIMEYPKQNGMFLADQKTNPPFIPIPSSNWWASCNYYLSVVPFLGAEKAGFFDNWPHRIRILKPNTSVSEPECGSGYCTDDHNEFCITIEECSVLVPAAMKDWVSFFKFVKEHEQLSSVHSPNQETFQTHLWQAHIDTIKSFSPMFKYKLQLMPDEESLFGTSWANLVDFVGMCHYSTDFVNVTRQQKFLPPRVLRHGDDPPYIPDMSTEVNGVLMIMERLHSLNERLGGYAEQVWKRLMCSAPGRGEGRYLLDNLPSRPWSCIPSLMRLMWDTIVQPCDDS